MKEKINRFIDIFENKFSFIIDVTALIGSIFTILLSITMFILLITSGEDVLNGIFIILLPGFLGFSAILMLFALRITRYLTKEDSKK